MDVEYSEGSIKIDIYSLFESMKEEDQKIFIKTLAVQRNITEMVIDSICGEDPDGWWSSYEDKDRMKVVRRVENAQLNGWCKYNWKFIEEATNRLKEIKEKRHIYWALYHGPFRDHLYPTFIKFCEANNIVSEYTTKQADEEIEQVLSIVKDALSKLVSE